MYPRTQLISRPPYLSLCHVTCHVTPPCGDHVTQPCTGRKVRGGDVWGSFAVICVAGVDWCRHGVS